ncbi:hypothetical protein HPK19_14565 [Arthrobacter citreus]|nr:hypothetical protein HPK19_14565 [Arthrobacter citreus]
MKIEQLSHLNEIIKSGSYRIAAEVFLVSEEVIRESIICLEIEFGFKLIECDDDSKVVPTFEGLGIISIVNEVLKKYEEFEEKVNSLRKNSVSNCNLMYDVSIL